MNDQFSRIKIAIGPEKFERLQKATIALMGIGAVGGYAAEALVRSGIGNLLIVDMDTIHVSNINRQILALHSTLNRRKVDVASERLLDINPQLNLKTAFEFIHTDTLERLLTPRPDFVLDAIDAVLPKVELLAYCLRNKIPVVSSMGAAFKKNLSNIRIVDISQTRMDPLSRIIRRRLRKRGITQGIPVVYSDEPGPPSVPPDDEELLKYSEDDSHRGRPRRILGSLCPMPGVFGMMAAHYVISQIMDPLLEASGDDILSNENQQEVNDESQFSKSNQTGNS